MALIDNYAASLDPRVIAQVTAAILLECANVYSEAPTITGHTTRAALATKISDGTFGSLQPLVLSACAYASLSATSSDTTVENAVAALWNQWAGV